MGADLMPQASITRQIMAEAVEKLLKKPFSAEIGEHCQTGDSLSY